MSQRRRQRKEKERDPASDASRAQPSTHHDHGLQREDKERPRNRNRVIARVLILLATLLFYSGDLLPALRSLGKSLGLKGWQSEVEGAYDVVEMTGKGKGALARRLIKSRRLRELCKHLPLELVSDQHTWKELATLSNSGYPSLIMRELIILEKPLFVVPAQTRESPSALISSKVFALSQADQDAFFSLSCSKPEVSSDELPLCIFETNVAVSNPGEVGIFPRMARLNHGCSSAFNAVYSFRIDENVLTVYALKDIQPGEELLTTYFDTKKPRDERQAYLFGQYHFICGCAICSLRGIDQLASDSRLRRMRDLQTRFASWGSSAIDGPETVDLARQIWSVGEEEGYTSERGRLASDVAHVAAAHSDASAVRSWMELAQKWYTIELGADSQQSREARLRIATPGSHPVWGSRRVAVVGDL